MRVNLDRIPLLLVFSFSSIFNLFLFFQLIFQFFHLPFVLIDLVDLCLMLYYLFSKYVYLTVFLNSLCLSLDRKLLLLIMKYDITQYNQPSIKRGTEVHLQLSLKFLLFFMFRMYLVPYLDICNSKR